VTILGIFTALRCEPSTHLIIAMDHLIAVVVVSAAVIIAVLSPLFQSVHAAPAATMPPFSLGVLTASPNIGELAHTLTEVDVYPAVINENSLHLKICRLAGGLV